VEGGLLEEVVDDKGKLSRRAVAGRLMEIGHDAEDAEERQLLGKCANLLDQQAVEKARLRAARDALMAQVATRYGKLAEADVRALVVDEKWLGQIAVDVQSEVDRISQALTGRICQLAERYAAPLPQLTKDAEGLAARVGEQLRRMGAVWS